MSLTASGLDRTLRPGATHSAIRQRFDQGLVAIATHGIDTSSARATESAGDADSRDHDQPPVRVTDPCGMRARSALRRARLLRLLRPHRDPGPRKE